MIHLIKNILYEIRIYQWIKNFLVFATLFFSKEIFNVDKFYLTFLVFLAFCTLASAVYIVNDIFDKEKDRNHPYKKYRPIASGQISNTEALIIFSILVIATIYLSIYFNLKTNLILLCYLILNLAYSFKLKQYAVVDIFIVAFMYFLRIKAGGEIIDSDVSNWLTLVTFSLALLLVTGKRRCEYTSLSEGGSKLLMYSKDFLDHLLTIVTASVLLSYSLYTIEIGITYLFYSIFIVFFGVMRYVYIVHKYGEGEMPEKLLFKDKWIFFSVISWLFYMFIIFYNANRFF